MGFSAVIVAGGSGKRFSAPVLKQSMPLFGLRMWEWSAKAFDASDGCDEIVIVKPKGIKNSQSLFRPESTYRHKLVFIEGGSERHLSVLNGIKKTSCEFVAIHDAARPLLKRQLIEKLWTECRKGFSVIPVTDVFDTIKEVKNGFVEKTVDRSKLRRIQTPQFFPKKIIENALASCTEILTDDSSYAEKNGTKVLTVPGDSCNFKITTREDFDTAQKLLASSARVGFGLDFHRYSENRDLILGGVKIPFELGLLGHSDADALYHAITDAVLGACGMRDIGFYFPDDNKSFLGASSAHLLKKALVIAGNPHIVNIDSVVVAEKPKLSPHVPEMIENISRTVGCDSSSVAVKATTSERMGPEGAMEGISARAVVSLLKF
ncbi:2-C-methyl-D-erythritol 2,4-cyclodiphosphate synthase [candidate division WOR-3 bacterium]|nr:2-C-methyl-D-erythritol 2,4-cyclodiphosphate synthase [candidate division WOR-3 bacterium]